MADEAKLIAVVEANTTQINRAMKDVARMMDASTKQMVKSVQTVDKSVGGLSNRMGALGTVMRRGVGGFGAGYVIRSIVQIIEKTVEMNDELRQQGLITAETSAKIKELGNAWRGASDAMAGFGSHLVSEFAMPIQFVGHQVEIFAAQLDDLLKTFDLLKRGDWEGALKRAWQGAGPEDRIAGAFEAAGLQPGDTAAGREMAARFLSRSDIEGFRAKAYWDTNAWRVGFGSSTTTKPTGVGNVVQIARVTAESTVTVADAMRDLQRRIVEFEHVIEAQIGPEAFRALPPGAQAALTSVAYNYGRLPSPVAAAAKRLDIGGIASAIQGLPANPMRRMKEAQLALTGTPGGDVLERQIEAKEKEVDEARKKAQEGDEAAAKRLNALEEQRNQLVFERALKMGEVTDEMKAQADAINESMAFNRDLVGGFIRDLERGVKPAEALANALQKIADRMLDLALNQIFPDVVAGAAGGGGGLLGKLLGFEKGGIMTSHGAVPLKRYQHGGVASGPQMALYGEGSRPEAYVPLPDGRSIPVKMNRTGVDVRGGIHVSASPDLHVTMSAISARQIGAYDAAAPSMMADRVRRRSGGR